MAQPSAPRQQNHLLPAFSSLRLVQDELRAYDQKCICTQRIEERRAALHASLERVLVIDMRFFWNGVGNSLPRWLASLRVGLAAGRATFLWMSDRGFDPEDVDRRTGRRLTQINRPGMSLDQRPHHPRLHRMERLARRGEGRGRAVLRNPKVLSRSNISLGRPMLVKPRRQHDASVTPTISYHPSKSQGFDLGEFFTAMGGDWRWDKHSLARVRAALSSRNQSQTPYLARYYCRRHTWACMQPRFEYGPGGSPSVAEPYSAARSDGTQFGGPTIHVGGSFEDERDGLLVAFLATRKDPFIVLRLAEQTALEQSAPFASMVLANGWLLHSKPGIDSSLSTLPFAGGGACGGPTRRRRNKEAENHVDGFGRWPWVAAPQPSLTEAASAIKEYGPSSLPTADWAAPLRKLLAGFGKDGARSRQSATCSNFALLRPREKLQAAMVQPISQLSAFTVVVGMHMRTGYADWTYRNIKSGHAGAEADSAYTAAVTAPRMRFSRQWTVLEAGLVDCTEAAHVANEPCFNWKNAEHRSPTVRDVKKLCGTLRPFGKATDSDAVIRTPGNGTLSAAVGCVATFGERMMRRQGPMSGLNASRWGLLMLGDSPALPSLVRSLPEMGARVIDTHGIGEIGHTSFGQSCEGKLATATGGISKVSDCTGFATVDPAGAWTRAMVDFYLGGMAGSFVTVLFSSWGGAMLSRSLLCCQHRYHFGAMYSQQYSHRDKPMHNVDFLQALTQVEVPGADPEEW